MSRYAHKPFLQALGGCIWIVALAGCDGPALHTVTGRVTYDDGTPVTSGIVAFSSIDLTPPVTARGPIQATGEFSLGTFAPGDGAPPGRYRAVIAPPPSDDPDVDPPSSVPEKYHSPQTSSLEFVVPTDGPLEIVVERP